MKVRTDFVTNSSSVSFILTMHKDIADTYMKFRERTGEAKAILALLQKELLEGTRAYIQGEEIYTKKLEFSTDETIDRELLSDEIDFSEMNDSELWSYIFGEYLLKGKLSEFEGFGAVQVKTY